MSTGSCCVLCCDHQYSRGCSPSNEVLEAVLGLCEFVFEILYQSQQVILLGCLHLHGRSVHVDEGCRAVKNVVSSDIGTAVHQCVS
jgi:hypothetical protein